MATHTEILVIPTGAGLGAEVRGLDLGEDLAAEAVAAIRRALLQHLVLVFSDQELTPRQQATFARRFGPLRRHGYVRGLAEQPEVIEIRKESEHLQNFGGVWHSDNGYLPDPPLGSVLYALEIPERGGDTLWANQYAAYDHLAPSMQAEIAGLYGVHCPSAAFGSMPRLGDPFAEAGSPEGRGPIPQAARHEARDGENSGESAHPLVRTHPETRRRSLFHSGPCLMRLKDRSATESRPLLDALLACATHDDIVYRHRWRRHDVVIWDNRCTMHVALNDYPGTRRVVHRVSIAGDVPF